MENVINIKRVKFNRVYADYSLHVKEDKGPFDMS